MRRAILFLGISAVCAACPDDEQEPISPETEAEERTAHLDGVWRAPCAPDEGGGSTRSELVISQSTLLLRDAYFVDAGCETPAIYLEHGMSFSVGAGRALEGTISDLDLTVAAIILTVHADEIARGLNAKSYCGFS